VIGADNAAPAIDRARAADNPPDVAARAVAGGQSPTLLRHVPTGLRAAADAAVPASAASGLQSTLAMAGAVGIVAGLPDLVLIRSAPTGAPTLHGEAATPTAADAAL